MIKSVQHVGITVSNLDEALHFFRDLLGLEALPFREVSGERAGTILGIPGASLRLSGVKTPDGKNVELIEYLASKGERINLKISNYGVTHISFVVDDIQKMYEDLTARGVTFISPPYWGGKTIAGMDWGVCFLKGPDGISVELMQAPKDK